MRNKNAFPAEAVSRPARPTFNEISPKTIILLIFAVFMWAGCSGSGQGEGDVFASEGAKPAIAGLQRVHATVKTINYYPTKDAIPTSDSPASRSSKVMQGIGAAFNRSRVAPVPILKQGGTLAEGQYPIFAQLMLPTKVRCGGESLSWVASYDTQFNVVFFEIDPRQTYFTEPTPPLTLAQIQKNQAYVETSPPKSATPSIWLYELNPEGELDPVDANARITVGGVFPIDDAQGWVVGWYSEDSPTRALLFRTNDVSRLTFCVAPLQKANDARRVSTGGRLTGPYSSTPCTIVRPNGNTPISGFTIDPNGWATQTNAAYRIRNYADELDRARDLWPDNPTLALQSIGSSAGGVSAWDTIKRVIALTALGFDLLNRLEGDYNLANNLANRINVFRAGPMWHQKYNNTGAIVSVYTSIISQETRRGVRPGYCDVSLIGVRPEAATDALNSGTTLEFPTWNQGYRYAESSEACNVNSVDWNLACVDALENAMVHLVRDFKPTQVVTNFPGAQMSTLVTRQYLLHYATGAALWTESLFPVGAVVRDGCGNRTRVISFPDLVPVKRIGNAFKWTQPDVEPRDDSPAFRVPEQAPPGSSTNYVFTQR